MSKNASAVKFGRYLVIGMLNTLWGFVSYPIFYALLARTGVHYLVILAFNYAFNATVAYWLQKLLVFKTLGNVGREYARFLVLQAIFFGINVVFLPFVVAIFGLNPVIGQMLFIVVVAIGGFFWNDKITFAGNESRQAMQDRNQVTLVTGASTGIGRALAIEYSGPRSTLLSWFQNLTAQASKRLLKNVVHLAQSCRLSMLMYAIWIA